MPETPLDEYLPTIRPEARDTVRTLAAAIEAADARLDCRHTYKMLVYTFDQKWHQWVVAVGVTAKAVNLRFLYGNALSDPAHILRPGSTTAATADFTGSDAVDPELVTAYVREAVERHPHQG